MGRTFEKDITKGSIWKNILLYFFPVWFGAVFQQMYTTVDAVIVGQFVGKEALAALGGTSGLLVDLSVGFFIGASAGAGVVVSHCYGAKDNERLRYAVRTSMKLALAAGAVLMVVGFLGTPAALQWMNAPEDILASAALYLKVYFMGVIPSLLYNMGSGILRAVGDAKRPLMFLIFTTFFNIGLDLLFVGIWNMGILGAALATIVSQAVSAVLILRTLLTTGESYRLVLGKCGSHPEILQKIIRLGLPSGFQYMFYTISNIVIQAQINLFGTNVVAAWTAINKIEGIFWLTMGAFGTSIMTFVGQNYGAGKMDRVKKCTWIGLIMAFGLTAGICIPVLVSAGTLLRLFTKDAAVLALALDYTYFLIPMYFTYTGTELFGGIIRGKGNSFVPMMITGISAFVIRILWAVTAPQIWPGMHTVMLSYPISWTLSTLLFVVYYVVKERKR